jgi:hypothetical protein
MVRYIVFTVLFLVCSEGLYANERFGLGIVLGEPTGLTGEVVVSEAQSVDAALSFEEDIYLHATYLFHQKQITPVQGARWTWYVGAGAFFEDRDTKPDPIDDGDDDVFIGPRGSLGSKMRFKNQPFEVFAELALNLALISETDSDLGIALGGRVRF